MNKYSLANKTNQKQTWKPRNEQKAKSEKKGNSQKKGMNPEKWKRKLENLTKNP